jgi:DNA-directed RNA polymerase specialized sigma24 family protein
MVLSHAYGAGWTVDEIAERQSLPTELVRRRLHDALRRLRVLTDDPAAVEGPDPTDRR